jgi:hypothetical protein
MSPEAPARAVVQRLLESQKFGVLATRTAEFPYLSLVAFAAAPDLGRLLFATARATSKYANLANDGRVAVLIDDRANSDTDLERASALTVVGDASELAGERLDRGLALFLGKHPSLQAFVSSPDTALFEVRVRKYILVREFACVETLEP